MKVFKFSTTVIWMANKVEFIEDYGIYRKGDSVWVWLYSDDPDQFKPEVDGKWVTHDSPEVLERLALDTLASHVASGEIKCLKYKYTFNSPFGLYADLLPPICIFANEEDKDEIHLLLLKEGLKDLYWKSNEDTIRDKIKMLDERLKEF